MFILISYDIEGDKTRSQIATVLEAHGERVQYSVFECHLKPSQFEKLKKRLSAIIEQGPDDEAFSIRYYRLCKSCISKIEIMGEGGVTEDPGYFIA